MNGMRKPEKGRFIVFEGIDGSGKTLQLARAAEWIRRKGYETVTLKEPTDGKWGTKIRSILEGNEPVVTPEEELMLFINDRRENISEHILPALEKGCIILQDRYYYSSIAYQGARGLNTAEIESRHKTFVVKPDLLLIFDIDPQKGLERICQTRNSQLSIFERIDYLRRVKEIYDALSGDYILHINAGKSPDEVQSDLQMAIQSRLLH